MLRRAAGAGGEGAPGALGLISGTALTSIAILLVNLGSGVAQARGLGPEGRGELAVAMLWPTVLAGVGGLGIREAVVYRTARGPSVGTQVLPTSLAIGLLQTLLLALVGWLLFPVVLQGKPPQLLQETMFYLWILPLFPLTLYPNGFLQGRMAMLPFNLTRFCVNCASTAPLLALWLLHRMTVHAALVASLLATTATAALCFALVVRRDEVTWWPRRDLFRPLLSFGARLHVGNVASIVTQRVDLLVLSIIVTAGSLGTYAVATSAAMVASLLPAAASYVLYPAFARQTSAALGGTLARLLLRGGLLTVLGGPVLVVVLPLAIPVLFGSGFRGAVQLTAVLALGYLLRGWTLILASVLRGAGRPFTASAGQAVELILLAALLFALVPRLGTMGAAAAVVVGATSSLSVLLVAALVSAGLSVRAMLGLWLVEVRRWRGADAAAGSASMPGLHEQ